MAKSTADLEKRLDDLYNEFVRVYSGLSERGKEIMKDYPILYTEEDAVRCLGFMKVLALFQI